MTWQPPTRTPQAGQGPWCNLDCSTWWAVADRPWQALAVIGTLDADVFPRYFGWRAIVEPCCIRWVDPDDWNEEHEIKECDSDYEDHAEGWRVTVVDA